MSALFFFSSSVSEGYTRCSLENQYQGRKDENTFSLLTFKQRLEQRLPTVSHCCAQVLGSDIRLLSLFLSLSLSVSLLLSLSYTLGLSLSLSLSLSLCLSPSDVHIEEPVLFPDHLVSLNICNVLSYVTGLAVRCQCVPWSNSLCACVCVCVYVCVCVSGGQQLSGHSRRERLA